LKGDGWVKAGRWFRNAVAAVKAWANTQLALVIAYGVDLTAVTILMYNIAPGDVTKWAYFAMGYLLVTVKLTAIRKGWLVAWAIAALVNVFTTTSFFVTTSVPETIRPDPIYVVDAKATFTLAETEYNTFHTGRQDAIDTNRLSLLRDQFTPAAAEAVGLKLETARRNLTIAKERALAEPVTALEVFGRVQRLLETKPDFAVISLIVFWLFASTFVELVLFYLKGGRFRKVRTTTDATKTDGADDPTPPAVSEELTTTPPYPRNHDGSLVPPAVAAATMNVSFDVALALYADERKKDDPQNSNATR
jgi:hypothetical protein